MFPSRFVTFCYTFLESLKKCVFGNWVEMVKIGKNRNFVAKKCNIVTLLKKSVTAETVAITAFAGFCYTFTLFSINYYAREKNKSMYIEKFCGKKV